MGVATSNKIVKVTLFNSTIGKMIKTALYIAVSAGISWIISELAKNPDIVGPAYPIVNVVLVFIVNYFKKDVQNIPDTIR